MVLWLNGSLWNQKGFFYGIAVKKLLNTFIFKIVYAQGFIKLWHKHWF